MRQFTVVFEPAAEGGYIVHVPALPGCHSQGETIQEAEENAKEAIECYLITVKDMGDDIPEERSGTKVVTISTEVDLSS